MQSGKERVLRAIEFRNPDKIPMWLSFNRNKHNYPISEDIFENYESDMIQGRCADPDFVPVAPGHHWLGYKRESLDAGGGEVLHPPLEDWSKFDFWKSHLPDYTKESCYVRVKELREANPDKFLVGALFLLMEDIINLRGYENYMIDFYEEEENLNRLIDELYRIAKDMVDGYAAVGCDGVIAWEDWGLQNSPMMSYELWEKFFYDKMKDFVDYVHGKGMKYILHSCGHITYLMDAFAEMGVDVLQLDQQKNMGLDLLSKWKGKFCFCCPIDIQHSLRMTPNELEAYAAEMVEKLSTEQGGFIYKPYEQPAAIGMYKERLNLEVASIARQNERKASL